MVEILSIVIMLGVVWALGYFFFLACGRTKPDEEVPNRWRKRSRWDV